MARRRKSSGGRKRRSWAGCRCPVGSTKRSTKGRGRGWVCQSNSPKGKSFPFVRAVCGR